MEVSRVPLLWDIEKEKGYTRYTLLPYRPSYRSGHTLPKPRVQVPMGERGLEPSHHNSTRQHCGLPTRKPWRLPRPSAKILRGLMTNIEKGHEPTARVGVDPGAIQKVILGAIWETILGTEQEPKAKAPHTVSQGVHSLSLDR